MADQFWFDKEEIHENCTVQILTNTQTGDSSIRWWYGAENDMPVKNKKIERFCVKKRIAKNGNITCSSSQLVNTFSTYINAYDSAYKDFMNTMNEYGEYRYDIKSNISKDIFTLDMALNHNDDVYYPTIHIEWIISEEYSI